MQNLQDMCILYSIGHSFAFVINYWVAQDFLLPTFLYTSLFLAQQICCPFSCLLTSAEKTNELQFLQANIGNSPSFWNQIIALLIYFGLTLSFHCLQMSTSKKGSVFSTPSLQSTAYIDQESNSRYSIRDTHAYKAVQFLPYNNSITTSCFAQHKLSDMNRQ